MSQQPQWARAPFIEALRSHSDTPHSVEVLCTKISPSQRPQPDNKQYSQETDLQSLGGNRNHNPSKQATSDPCPTLPLGRYDNFLGYKNISCRKITEVVLTVKHSLKSYNFRTRSFPLLQGILMWNAARWFACKSPCLGKCCVSVTFLKMIRPY
jgi:hypothetical protein